MKSESGWFIDDPDERKRLFEMTFPDLAKASVFVSLKCGRSGIPGVSDVLRCMVSGCLSVYILTVCTNSWKQFFKLIIQLSFARLILRSWRYFLSSCFIYCMWRIKLLYITTMSSTNLLIARGISVFKAWPLGVKWPIPYLTYRACVMLWRVCGLWWMCTYTVYENRWI